MIYKIDSLVADSHYDDYDDDDDGELWNCQPIIYDILSVMMMLLLIVGSHPFQELKLVNEEEEPMTDDDSIL